MNMKKKNFVFAYAALLAAGMMALASCESSEVFNQDAQAGQKQEQGDGKAIVKLVFSSAPLVAYSRASLVANDKELTDLYILDYDKKAGKLLQVLHQTSAADDFAEPSLALSYGEHTLKVVATRSLSPTLLDGGGSLWSVQDNTAFAVAEDGSVPVVWTSEKTSDSFGASKDVTIAVGKNQTINIQLERMVAKLVVRNTDEFPDDCSTLQLSMDEYKQWSWQTFDVMDAVANQRVSDVTSYAGTTGKTISYFFLTPADGYTTDITFTMGRKDKQEPYAVITVPDVKLQRNHITTVTGSLYNHQAAMSLTVNDDWDEEQNSVEF